MRNYREYAIYKGDTFIDIGTAKELAARHNLKVGTIYETVHWEKRNVKPDGNGLIAVPLTDTED